MSVPEDNFARQLDGVGVVYEREFKFLPDRKFRADFLLPGKVLVEIEGGVWIQGGHTRGGGYSKDCEKYNLAQLNGYKVFRFTPQMVESGWALAIISAILSQLQPGEE